MAARTGTLSGLSDGDMFLTDTSQNGDRPKWRHAKMATLPKWRQSKSLVKLVKKAAMTSVVIIHRGVVFGVGDPSGLEVAVVDLCT